jgi:hypothetical protein
LVNWVILALLAVAPVAEDRTGTFTVAQGPPRVDSLRFSKPSGLARLDMQKLGGEPSRLAWSFDGEELYLQTLAGGFGKPNATSQHYIIDAGTGAVREVRIEPEWAAQYWLAKSGQNSPDDPPLRIDLQTERRQERTTSLPGGGGLARGAPTPQITENDELSILARQTVPLITLLFHGEVVGQFVNSVLVPGLTYGWGPMGAKIIAFAAQKTGRLVVIDDQGQKKEIAGSKDALLPAWSPDGDRIAWLEKDGRRRFKLQISKVSVE